MISSPRWSAPPSSFPHVLDGAPPARLFAGPPRTENWEEHRERLGELAYPFAPPEELLSMIRASGLGGRGGSGYPTANKISHLRTRQGSPTVIINGAESEPASRKDLMLATIRPHLVIDGALLAASAAGADRIVIYLHRHSHDMLRMLDDAVRQRVATGATLLPITFTLGPDHYVAGESSAIVAHLRGGEAKPSRETAAGGGGIGNRPTIVHNLETVAHLALIARLGPAWFRTSGTPSSPGSLLVTLTGAIATPGLVIELTAPTTIGALLTGCGVTRGAAVAILLGGYAGTWATTAKVWDVEISRESFACEGLTLGCGLIGVLPPGGCGLAESATILGYFARESAGQCGPCMFGLPELSRYMSDIARGDGQQKAVDAIQNRAALLFGRGSCHHPDGAILQALSALDVFEADLTAHLRGTPCLGAHAERIFPIPPPSRTWR